jgi:adenosylcobinamide kinase/adenosylcobinamide-phosphate guanylyltransferase
MKKITLVLGGIRSGKSVFAEKRALLYHDNPVYVATATAGDEEMEARITWHRQRRGNRFRLIEEPLDLNRALEGLKDQTVVVDCMTLNLSNRLLEAETERSLQELIHLDEQYLDTLIELVEAQQLNIIFVSNEAGLAPVSANTLGRFFQDLQGRWNRKIAAAADEVFFMQAGIPRILKKEPLMPFRLGAPSYVLPTGYIENVTYLIGRVHDVELLLFSNQEDDPLFKPETISTLRYLQQDGDLTYTVHMPVEPTLFADSKKLASRARQIIETLAPLNILTYIFHYDLPSWSQRPNFEQSEKARVDHTYIQFFQSLLTQYPGLPIALENTVTPLSALDTVVDTCRIFYCIDMGHLLAQRFPMHEITTRLPQTPVIHLHGVEFSEQKNLDHRALSFDPSLFQYLEGFPGVVTVEVFHKTLLGDSLAVIRDYF